MTRKVLERSVSSLRDHLDPEKDEQLTWMKKETEKKVGKILRLARSISGNKDGDSKQQFELIHLVEEVHRQYESLHFLYETLRAEVKNNFRGTDSSPSPTSSDSESYFSADESSTVRNTAAPNTATENIPNAETSDAEFAILKDKLTSSSKVKDLRSQSAAVDEVLKQQPVHDEKTESVNFLKHEIEEWLSRETDERSSQVKRMMEQMDSLQKELLSVNGQKAKLEFELEKKSAEDSECFLQIENFKRKLMDQESVQLQAKDLEGKLASLSSKKHELEEQIAKANREAHLSEARSQELQKKLLELQASLTERENKLLAEQKKFEACCAQIESLNEKLRKHENASKELYNERNSLRAEVETLRNEKGHYKMELEQEKQRESQLEKINTELTNKIADDQKTMVELGDAKDKLISEHGKAHQSRVEDAKINLQQMEKKMEEMAQEIWKEFEAKYKPLSHRIKLAEQQQVEHNEWWGMSREMYEDKIKELREWTDRSKTGIANIKGMSITTNNLLISLDRIALRFEECTANFLNRISKSSCELKFTRDWAMRKNKALLHVKNELDYLLLQLDEKEAEVLIVREKIWKSDNKVRELEKMIKKKEDGMLALEEEKREAIRQLCVWIDYHRSRSDYYKKMVVEMHVEARRRA